MCLLVCLFFLFVRSIVFSILRLFYYTYVLKVCLIFLFDKHALSMSLIWELLTISVRQTITELPGHYSFSCLMLVAGFSCHQHHRDWPKEKWQPATDTFYKVKPHQFLFFSHLTKHIWIPGYTHVTYNALNGVIFICFYPVCFIPAVIYFVH